MSSLFQKIWNIIILIGSLITTSFFLFVFAIFIRAMRALHFRPVECGISRRNRTCSTYTLAT